MKKFHIFLVTSGGAGLIPMAPGTWGSLVGIGLALAGLSAGWRWIALIFGLTTAIGLALAEPARRHFNTKDPQKFVLDETAGQLAALLLLPLTPMVLLTGFILFRFFDIKKPLGICQIDQWNHPSGIVLDDLLAGLYANLILQVLVRLFPQYLIG